MRHTWKQEKAALLTGATDRKCIISHAVGTDHIDLAYCREANIQVMTCTGCNTESVAEHALSLYFATRRSLVSVHNTLADFEPGRPNEWKSKGERVTQNGAPLIFFQDGSKERGEGLVEENRVTEGRSSVCLLC